MSENETEHGYIMEDWNHYLVRERIFNIVFKSMCLVVGILGNFTVLFIYKFRLRNERRDRYFIPYLSVIDVLACVATCCMSIVKSTHIVTFPSGALCKALWCSLLATTSTSAFYLLVICVIRFRKVCYLKRTEMKLKTKKAILIGVAVMGFILALPSIFLYDLRTYSTVYAGYNVTGHTCSAMKFQGAANIAKIVYLCTLLLISIGVMSFMVILYTKIGQVIYKTVAGEIQRQKTTLHAGISTDKESGMTSSSTTNGTLTRKQKTCTVTPTRKAKHNFTRMFLTVTVVYVVSFTPSVVMIVALTFRDQQAFWMQATGWTLNILYFLSESYIFNHVANPFIYLYFDLKFRKELMSILGIKKEGNRVPITSQGSSSQF